MKQGWRWSVKQKVKDQKQMILTPELSIVIPAYKAAKIFPGTLKTISYYLKKKRIQAEIIIVDDKSPDNTIEVVEKLLIKHPEVKLYKLPVNTMKGWAVRTGVLKSRGKLVLTCDQDLSTPIEEYKKLLAQIKKGADLVVGIRIQDDGYDMRETQPVVRRLIGKFFSFLRGSLVGEIVDTQCGFKLFTKKVAKDLFSRQRVKNIIFDVEILAMAKKREYKIAQVPVVWKHDGRSAMLSSSLKKSGQLVFSLLKVWLRYH